MATILLSAAGAAIGGSIGGTVAGLSSVAIGRAVGATLGKAIDERLLGAGSEPRHVGRVDRFRVTGAGDGAPVARVFGRMRVGGQVIWASDFIETATTTGGGGKGSPKAPQTTRYSYAVSLAIALCEGPIGGVPRIWADGEEIAPGDLDLRVYDGSETQLPDPLIEAVEGAGHVPAYRGTAYVVIENLGLERFGNRVPQFSFEVTRPDFDDDLPAAVQAVALVPGTGEYALAADPVYYTDGPGSQWAANLNTPSGRTDLVTSMAALADDLPNSGAVSLVVSWFGDDLRCGSCTVRPKVERRDIEGANMPWSVAGIGRAQAGELARDEGRPIYGGTPADASVVQAIRHMAQTGRSVMFYPFILMEQMAGNALPDPYSDAETQPALPWRGRITTSVAPGRTGSPDGTAAARAEVEAFFGGARAAHFGVGNGTVSYGGPQDWGFARFILHYAALCAAAGGVDAFCIGSEMRGLTQIRGAAGSFPAVERLRQLARDVRALLGPGAKIGYAADWTEYFGYQPQDGSGDRLFHLDPLWADADVDFVGIDNYMPLSDWREGPDHLDAASAPSIYDLGYLRSNIEGGEGFDWYYHSEEARAAQIRTPITDAGAGEPWIWRFKDLRGWWENSHHDRIGGERSAEPTAWVPKSKPIWFTELGCAAIDKGTNEPNKFLDFKSSESSLPRYSTGVRDDYIQKQYLRAMLGYWADPERNPISPRYDGPMIDLSRAYVWAWDTRPFPYFPNRSGLWSDGRNYARGHWINGRASTRTLASVVTEICLRAGLSRIDAADLRGVVRGMVVDAVGDARSALQPLMLRHGFDAVERDGLLKFIMRDGEEAHVLDPEMLALTAELDATVESVRDAEAELSGRVRVRFVQADADHEVLAEEAVLPDDATHAVAASDLPLALTRAEGQQVAQRWLAEARIARDAVRFALPPSRIALGPGDVVQLGTGAPRYRIDRIEQSGLQIVDAVRIDPAVYRPAPVDDALPQSRPFAAPVPVQALFLDLPLMTGDEVPHAPHLALTARPWPGSVAVYASASDEDYALADIVAARSVIGVTQTPLFRAPPGLWDRGAPLQVRLTQGQFQSRSRAAVLNGANLLAIGDGTAEGWELLQFAQADLVGPDTWALSDRLRGQLGSDGTAPEVWPAGSFVVALDGTPAQIPLSSAQRGAARHFRIGPAQRTYDDPSYVHRVETFAGIGLRPYSPCHLRARESGGDLDIGWTRRSRIDADGWDGPDVPLGEEAEQYLLRISGATGTLRESVLTAPRFTWTAAMRAADQGALFAHVAQVSARFGPGPFATLELPA
jgi:hypothetical protein